MLKSFLRTHAFPSIHPLSWTPLPLILGIVWQSSNGAPVPLFAALLLVGVLLFRTDNRTRALWYCGAVILFFGGSARYLQQQNNFEHFYTKTLKKKCSMRGTITDWEPSYRYPGQTLMTVKIDTLTNGENELVSAKNNVIIVTTRERIQARVGDTLECDSVFFRPCPPDFKKFLTKENLKAYIYTKNLSVTPQAHSILNRLYYALKQTAVAQRNRIVAHLKYQLSPNTFTLLSSIFFGKKQVNQKAIEPIKDSFKTWGIVHYLARSGLHVILFIFIWTFLLRALPIPGVGKHIFLVLLMFSYAALSWTSVSFSRALVLFFVYTICMVLDLQINVLYILCITATCFLLYNPFQLFFLDFQLSFGLTYALALLNASLSLQRPSNGPMK